MSKQSFMAEICDILEARNDTHGAATGDFQRIADMWSTLFNRVFTPHEVAMAMVCLKLSRITWNPEHKDSWQDLAGYAACGWECVEDGNTLRADPGKLPDH